MKKKIIAGILLVVFIIWAVLVKTNSLTCFDDAIYKFVTANMNDTLTSIYKFITFFGSTKFMVAFAIILFVLFIVLKKNKISYITSSCLIISTILNNAIKLVIRRARPDVIKLVIEKSFSFPSGHMMASTSLYGILIYLILKSDIKKPIKYASSIGLGLLIILVGLSRIYLGAHFASDIIGAVLVSTIWLLLLTSFLEAKDAKNNK